MRSKEVDEAIKFLKNYSFDTDEDFSNVKTVLSYIETLEQLPNKIRDKIKELEQERKKIESSPYDKWDLYKVIGKIKVLKSIIGE